MSQARKGLFQHYRKGQFRVIGIATDHDTQQKAVIFHPEGDPDTLWSRSVEDFEADVQVDNRQEMRFTYLGD